MVRIRVNNQKIFMTLYVLLLITRLLSYVNEVQHSFYTPVSIFVLIFFIIINISIRIKVIRNKSAKWIIGAFVFWIFWGVIYGTLFAVDKNAVLNHFAGAVVFYLNTFFCARIVCRYKLGNKFLKVNLFVIGSFLIWRYIVNFNGFEFVDSISTLFNSDSSSRYRYSYGLYHANAAGNICLCFIILMILYVIQNNKFRKIHHFSFFRMFLYMTTIVSTIMLFSTASRNSITSLAVFILAYLWIKYYSMSGARGKLVKGALLIIFLSVLAWNMDFISLLSVSNRLYNFTHNLPMLTKYNSWLTGLGFVDSGYFGSSLTAFDTIYVDNFYLYVLLSTGIVGCIILFIPLIYFMVNLFKRHINATNDNRCIEAIFITCLYSAFFETNLLYPMFISSLIYWVLFILKANEVEN